jgi:hypothetical protein
MSKSKDKDLEKRIMATTGASKAEAKVAIVEGRKLAADIIAATAERPGDFIVPAAGYVPTAMEAETLAGIDRTTEPGYLERIRAGAQGPVVIDREMIEAMTGPTAFEKAFEEFDHANAALDVTEEAMRAALDRSVSADLSAVIAVPPERPHGSTRIPKIHAADPESIEAAIHTINAEMADELEALALFLEETFPGVRREGEHVMDCIKRLLNAAKALSSERWVRLYSGGR